MNAAPTLAVTLPRALIARLSEEAAALGLPLEWLVAALVVALDGQVPSD